MKDWSFLYHKFVKKQRVVDGIHYRYKPFCSGAHNEPFFRPFILKKGDCLIDIGANIGGWTIPASPFYNTIWAFEAWPYVAKVLEKNLRINHVKNVRVFPVALGDKVEEKDLWLYKSTESDWSMMGSIDNDPHFLPPSLKETRKHTVIQTRRLDEYFDPNLNITIHPSVVKIDTEGYEIPILKGAKNMIEQYHPGLALEAHYPDDIGKIMSMFPSYRWELAERGNQTMMIGT
jgi:FkbM family methyltransferase